MAFCQVKSLQKWSVSGAHLSWRRVFCPSGIIRQKSTKCCETFRRSDLDKVKRLTLHSVSIETSSDLNLSGIPLSEVYLNVIKVSSMLCIILVVG